MRALRFSRVWFWLACAQLAGCELVADFDRGKIEKDASVDANFAPRDTGPGDEDAGDADK